MGSRLAQGWVLVGSRPAESKFWGGCAWGRGWSRLGLGLVWGGFRVGYWLCFSGRFKVGAGWLGDGFGLFGTSLASL